MRDMVRTLSLTFALVLIGCSHRAPLDPVLPSTEVSEFIEHRISYPGETLASIAHWYTGSQKQWVAIQQANPELRPNKLKVGSIVRIPRVLVRRTAMMPRPRAKANSAPSVLSTIPPSGSPPLPDNRESTLVPVADAPTAEKEEGAIVAYEEPAEATLPATAIALPEPEIDLSAVPETRTQDEEYSASTESQGSFLSALGKALAPSR
jgi:LysM domain